MGFLEAGVPMTWEDSEEYYKILEYVRKHGALQFLEVFNKVKDRKNDVLKWGDEIEYHLFRRNDEDKSVELLCVAHELLQKLSDEDKDLGDVPGHMPSVWHPEWGAWMIEATPGAPYGKHASDLLDLEESLRYRRARIQRVLGVNEGLCSLPAWPRMGREGFVESYRNIRGDRAMSNYLPDDIINPHPRFGTLVQNIRLRRGRNVEIHMPIFKDKNTNVKELNDMVSSLPNANDILQKEEIYMDGMGFGMGCCCLQVTFQARDLKESRYLYDQLAVVCPIFLALSAGTSILKGHLADTDCRWDVIAQSVDCRTPKEYGREPLDAKKDNLQRGKMKINKSRYDSIDLFISDSPLLKNKYKAYNDLDSEVNEETLKLLMENGVDEILSRHVAHLFIRDPLVIFSDRIDLDDKTTTEHFENIQSTNWQTMRWKPPPVAKTEKDAIGWRVEFRPMESQLTDFENAAYTITIVLLSRVILFFNLNFYIPMSKVDENMQRARKRDAVLKQKFHFRKNLVPLESECQEEEDSPSLPEAKESSVEDEYEEMTISEILNGKGEKFPGLFPLIYAYLDIIDCDENTYETINRYLKFISDRSEGKVKTLARWMRDFVAAHPDYKEDSEISKSIEYDLVNICSEISNGRVHDPSLLGKNVITKISKEMRSGPAPSNLTVDDMKKKLRGASFSENLTGLQRSKKKYECQVVLDLIDKYRGKAADHIITEKSGFLSTPAFLSGNV